MMIAVNSQRVIEIIRNEICNPDLNANYIAYKLDCSQPSIWKTVKDDFKTTPYRLIVTVRCHKIFKYTYDHRYGIYKSSKIYGIVKSDTFYKLIKNKFDKLPCEIEHELAMCDNRKENFYKYCKKLKVYGLIL